MRRNPRWSAVLGARGQETGALGTEPLSGAKRSRRGDKGSVPMAGSAEKVRREAGPRWRAGARVRPNSI